MLRIIGINDRNLSMEIPIMFSHFAALTSISRTQLDQVGRAVSAGAAAGRAPMGPASIPAREPGRSMPDVRHFRDDQFSDPHPGRGAESFVGDHDRPGRQSLVHREQLRARSG